MLPPGTLSALKGHSEAIVAVVCLAVTFGAIGAGVSSWAAIAAPVIVLAAFHIRCVERESDDRAALSERMFSRMVATPKQDVTMAVAVTRFCSDVPFSTRYAGVAAAWLRRLTAPPALRPATAPRSR